ncbi:type III secretion system effector XopAE [Paracidovorax konjaci]|uniref:type III secretion system effector XopAE n=1 Tax=Paracidovorax konjaci TaxID=32040 RepID=UPI001C318C43|nr:type III secretion system effector XopAE [Paracidovorax konjaci]
MNPLNRLSPFRQRPNTPSQQPLEQAPPRLTPPSPESLDGPHLARRRRNHASPERGAEPRSPETIRPRGNFLGRLLRTGPASQAHSQEAAAAASASTSATRQPASVGQEIDQWLAQNRPSAQSVRTGLNFHDGTEDTSRQILDSVAAAMQRAAATNGTRLELEFGLPATSLPEALGRIQSLQQITLRSTGLQSLPESLGQLSQLNHLEISSSQALRRLPASLTQLPSLKTLTLATLPLHELPADIGRLQSLRKLTLNSGEYSRLPASVTQLTGLRELQLSHSSHLQGLPDDIGRMAGLQTLTVSSQTHLSQLPASLTDLARLQSLQLEGNRQLRALPDDLGRLDNLTSLSLRNCSALTQLPDSVGNLRHLRRLDLTGTGLQSLPPSLARLPAQCEILVPDSLRRQLRELRNPQAAQAPRRQRADQPGPSRSAGAGPSTRRPQLPRAVPTPLSNRLAALAQGLDRTDRELAADFRKWTNFLSQRAALLHHPVSETDLRLLDKVVAEAVSSETFRSSFSEFLQANTPRRLNEEGATQVLRGQDMYRGVDVRTAYAHLLEHKLMRMPDAKNAETFLRASIQELGMGHRELLRGLNPLTGRAQIWPPLRAYVAMQDELGMAAQEAATTWAMAQADEAEQGVIGEGEAMQQAEHAQVNANSFIDQRARELLAEWNIAR